MTRHIDTPISTKPWEPAVSDDDLLTVEEAVDLANAIIDARVEADQAARAQILWANAQEAAARQEEVRLRRELPKLQAKAADAERRAELGLPSAKTEASVKAYRRRYLQERRPGQIDLANPAEPSSPDAAGLRLQQVREHRRSAGI